MSCMLTDQYRFYVFCQRDISEAGPARAGVPRWAPWPPHAPARGLTGDNKPKKPKCLKGNNNNNGEERAEGRSRGLVCVSALSFTMARDQEPGGHGAAEPHLQNAGLIPPGGLSSRINARGAPGAGQAPGSPGQGTGSEPPPRAGPAQSTERGPRTRTASPGPPLSLGARCPRR